MLIIESTKVAHMLLESKNIFHQILDYCKLENNKCEIRIGENENA